MRRVAITAVVVFLLDQVSKLAVVWGLGLATRGQIDVWPPYLTFRMAWNRGVNFGLFASGSEVVRWVLIAVALGISVWVWRWVAQGQASRLVQVSAGLLIGGALGNVVDRVVYGFLAGKVEGVPFGAVADFLNMSCCGFENPYAFNVADIAIFVGAVGLVLFADSGKTPGKGGRAPRRKTP
ncbi:signal peptidase II [Paracoccaceae bacterium Fryx2]|nr:signal peptidase II [Paracoccaceae bacterium Fryx2]